MLGMNRLSIERRTQILGMMVEGMAIRAISRLTGASKNTIVKLLIDAGRACSGYQDRTLRNLPCERVQVDEVWSFVGMKQRNVPEDKKGQLGIGDVWTWTAIDAETKLIPSWFVGARDAEHARAFLSDLASRMAGRIQLTSDGHAAYRDAGHDAFINEIDYAQLVKIYGDSAEAKQEKRYSPAECIGCERHTVKGNPDPKHISTSHVERQNLNIRMGLRRFTRLTNAFSKKMENHLHALSIYFMHYNFCRIHQTLRITPAMAACASNHVWDMAELVDGIDVWEHTPTNPTTPNADLDKLLGDADSYTKWVKDSKQRGRTIK
jgi:IS1 family transposase